MGSRNRNPSREIAPARSRVTAHPSDDHRRASRHSALEERVAAQHREIHSLLVDNQRLASTHLALKQDLSDAHQDLRHLSAAVSSIKSERGAQVRDVFERSLKLEAELRSVEASGAELAQVGGDVQKHNATRQELAAKLKAVDGDVGRALSEARQLPAVMEEIEGMHHEIQRGRAAVEYEKKARDSNLEYAQVMEKNMISVSHEIENLHAQLANVEKRAQAAATAANPSVGYAATYGNHELGYGGSSYPGHYSIHQVPGGVSASPQFALSGATTHPYGVQQTDMPR